MSDLVLYTNPMSRGRIARWMLEEVGVPYRTEILDYGTTMKAPAYLAINPMGKVPALVRGDVVVTECAAICAWLADAYPEAGLSPATDSAARGAYFRWMFFAAGPVEQAVVNASLKVELKGPQEEARAGYGSLARVCDVLEGLLSDGRPHLLGDRFSALDVYLGAQIGWGLAFGSMPERPSFRPYAERILSRPAAVRAREIDDALMPKGTPAG
jgi:glutathione S-transferase